MCILYLDKVRFIGYRSPWFILSLSFLNIFIFFWHNALLLKIWYSFSSRCIKDSFSLKFIILLECFGTCHSGLILSFLLWFLNIFLNLAFNIYSDFFLFSSSDVLTVCRYLAYLPYLSFFSWKSIGGVLQTRLLQPYCGPSTRLVLKRVKLLVSADALKLACCTF